MQRSCKSGTSSSCLSLWLQSLAGLSHFGHVVSSPLGLCRPSVATRAGQEIQAGTPSHSTAHIHTTCRGLVIQATYKTCLPGRTQHPCPSSNSPRLARLSSTGQRCKDRWATERLNPWNGQQVHTWTRAKGKHTTRWSSPCLMHPYSATSLVKKATKTKNPNTSISSVRTSHCHHVPKHSKCPSATDSSFYPQAGML